MLTHYLDFKYMGEEPNNSVLNDIHFLLRRNRVFNTGHVAVDFPSANFSECGLGKVLRVLGPEEEVRAVYALNIHHRISDLWCVGVLSASNVSGYRVLTSIALNGNAKRERMIRRHIERGVTREDAEQKIRTQKPVKLNAPFLMVNSSGQSGAEFKMFLQKKDSEECFSGFNHYGLSQKGGNFSSVPNIDRFRRTA